MQTEEVLPRAHPTELDDAVSERKSSPLQPTAIKLTPLFSQSSLSSLASMAVKQEPAEDDERARLGSSKLRLVPTLLHFTLLYLFARPTESPRRTNRVICLMQSKNGSDDSGQRPPIRFRRHFLRQQRARNESVCSGTRWCREPGFLAKWFEESTQVI